VIGHFPLAPLSSAMLTPLGRPPAPTPTPMRAGLVSPPATIGRPQARS